MTSVEALTERLLLVETLTQRMQVQLQAVSDQQTIQMTSHQSLHQELQQLSSRVANQGRPNSGIDKLLLPARYNGDKELWRQFSSKLISCIGKAYPALKPAMTEIMGTSKEVDDEKVRELRISDEGMACLGEQLTSLLEGEAWMSIEKSC